MRAGERMPWWQLPVAAALATLAVWAIGPAPAAIPALHLAAVAPELVRVDLAEHRLPNRIVVPGIPAGLAAAALTWAAGGDPRVALVAGVAYPALLLAFALAGGMGMGDVKLATVIGLASPAIPVAVLAPALAFLAGGVASVVVLARRGRGSRIAFGPFLLLGYFGALAVAALGAVPA